MAKCNKCLRVKGKRQCLAFNGLICSSCCGISRNGTMCAGCSFYKTAAETRRYDKIPHFGPQKMDESPELQDYSNVIEGALCTFDHRQDHLLNDEFYKKVLERLFDRYVFGDQELLFANDIEEKGFASIDSAIKEDLTEVESELLCKILGTVYRSLKRHAAPNYSGRTYMDFIRQYVGVRVASGIRALPTPGGQN